jgi:hypothetical protein
MPVTFIRRSNLKKLFVYKNSEGSETIPVRANWELGPLKITF